MPNSCVLSKADIIRVLATPAMAALKTTMGTTYAVTSAFLNAGDPFGNVSLPGQDFRARQGGSTRPVTVPA